MPIGDAAGPTAPRVDALKLRAVVRDAQRSGFEVFEVMVEKRARFKCEEWFLDVSCQLEESPRGSR